MTSSTTSHPAKDQYQIDLKNSIPLKTIAGKYGIKMDEVLDEINQRVLLLRKLRLDGIRRNIDVAKKITNYYIENEFPKPRITPKQK